MRILFFISMVLFVGAISVKAQAETLRIVYQDRLPYYVIDRHGSIGGLVAGPIAQALKKAGIQAQWEKSPAKRQLETIRSNVGSVCSPGWFKKPEREKFAKFSVPVYQDQPQIIVMRTSDHRKLSHDRFEALLADKTYSIGVKKAYSYGTYIDALIALHVPKTVATSQGLVGIMKMLLGKRFDYFITTPEEYQTTFAKDHRSRSDVVAVEFGDIPPGNFRYLMCSKRVDDKSIEAFNKAITQ